MTKLSNLKIKQLKSNPERFRMIGDGQRLYLCVYPSGLKKWVLRSSGRVTAQKTLGKYPDMSLADARRIAHSERKTTAHLFNRSTVKELVQEFYASQVEPHNKAPEEVLRYLNRDLAPILGKPIVDVTRADLATLFRDKAKTAPVAANILLGTTKRMFKFAVISGALETDPATLLDRSMAGGTQPTRERVLTDDEIKKLWSATAPGQGTPLGPQHRHGPLIRMLLICGQRITETKEARWEDIDFKKKIWHIPAERTKTGRVHWIALPELAVETLKPLSRDTDYVFPQSTTTAIQSWIGRWCDREEIVPSFTPHDLRRTMATRMNEIGIAPHVVEKILNHQMGGVMGIYNRAAYESERIEAQSTWAKSLQTIVSPRATRPRLRVVLAKQ